MRKKPLEALRPCSFREKLIFNPDFKRIHTEIRTFNLLASFSIIFKQTLKTWSDANPTDTFDINNPCNPYDMSHIPCEMIFFQKLHTNRMLKSFSRVTNQVTFLILNFYEDTVIQGQIQMQYLTYFIAWRILMSHKLWRTIQIELSKIIQYRF